VYPSSESNFNNNDQINSKNLDNISDVSLESRTNQLISNLAKAESENTFFENPSNNSTDQPNVQPSISPLNNITQPFMDPTYFPSLSPS
jgi:hypothetical protein